MVGGFWDWECVFKMLTEECEERGRYCLSIEDGADCKDGDIGIGWGRYNLETNVIPRYKDRYSNYMFWVSNNRYYLCCENING